MIRFVFCMLALLISTGAQAHKVHHHPARYAHVEHYSQSARHGHHHYAAHRYGTRIAYHDGRPSAWCGWQMRQWLGGGPELNLARNWARVGSPTSPQVGAVVVWPHHVGLLTGRTPSGEWIVKSGNDGHAVRERPRSVAGAIAFRMVGRI